MRSTSSKPSRKPSRRKSRSKPKNPALTSSQKRRFQQRLLKWYGEHGRDLPWRKTSDPYHILISEVMLQQTQVDRVIPKYHEFLERYPSFEHLAEAPVADVKKTWYPLGYNIRPERLHSIACETVERYGGQLPNDADELLSFKGIGRYTAGAIRSFAFNEDAPILDTNVILHDAGCLRSFEEHDIAIPITVLEELDRFTRALGGWPGRARVGP